MDGWVKYAFDGYVSADVELFDEVGDRISVSFSCRAQNFGLAISIPRKLVSTAIVGGRTPVHITTDFGHGRRSFAATNLQTRDAQLIILELGGCQDRALRRALAEGRRAGIRDCGRQERKHGSPYHHGHRGVK